MKTMEELEDQKLQKSLNSPICGLFIDRTIRQNLWLCSRSLDRNTTSSRPTSCYSRIRYTHSVLFTDECINRL